MVKPFWPFWPMLGHSWASSGQFWKGGIHSMQFAHPQFPPVFLGGGIFHKNCTQTCCVHFFSPSIPSFFLNSHLFPFPSQIGSFAIPIGLKINLLAKTQTDYCSFVFFLEFWDLFETKSPKTKKIRGKSDKKWKIWKRGHFGGSKIGAPGKAGRNQVDPNPKPAALHIPVLTDNGRIGQVKRNTRVVEYN